LINHILLGVTAKRQEITITNHHQSVAAATNNHNSNIKTVKTCQSQSSSSRTNLSITTLLPPKKRSMIFDTGGRRIGAHFVDKLNCFKTPTSAGGDVKIV